VVLDVLKQLERALSPHKEIETANNRVARVVQRIEHLVAREKQVLGATRQLEAARGETDRRDEAQQIVLKNLATEQQQLSDETERLRSELAGAAAFGLAIEDTLARMKKAGELLRNDKTGAATQQAEQAAITRLEQVLAALRPNEPPADGAPMPPDDPVQRSPKDSAGDPARVMAQIKLILVWQQELNRRTAELETMRPQTGALTADQQQELAGLVRDQGRLADAMIALGQIIAERKEQNQ